MSFWQGCFERTGSPSASQRPGSLNGRRGRPLRRPPRTKGPRLGQAPQYLSPIPTLAAPRWLRQKHHALAGGRPRGLAERGQGKNSCKFGRGILSPPERLRWCDLTGTDGLRSGGSPLRPTHSPASQPEPGRGQPKRPLPPRRGPPSHWRACPTQRYRFQNPIELPILFASPHSPDSRSRTRPGQPKRPFPPTRTPPSHWQACPTQRYRFQIPNFLSFSPIAHGSWIGYISY